MPDSDVDKAFDLLVVIIALIYSIVGSYPELFWGSTPELSLEIQTMRNTVFPLIVLTLLWLASILIPNKNGQVLVKCVAWMTAFSLGISLFIGYLDGTKFIRFSPLMELINIVFFFLVNPLIVYLLIFPRYKEKYPDEPFFKRKIWPVVSYALFLLVMGTIIFVTATRYAAW